jgi:hypothetical protein
MTSLVDLSSLVFLRKCRLSSSKNRKQWPALFTWNARECRFFSGSKNREREKKKHLFN